MVTREDGVSLKVDPQQRPITYVCSRKFQTHKEERIQNRILNNSYYNSPATSTASDERRPRDTATVVIASEHQRHRQRHQRPRTVGQTAGAHTGAACYTTRHHAISPNKLSVKIPVKMVVLNTVEGAIQVCLFLFNA